MPSGTFITVWHGHIHIPCSNPGRKDILVQICQPRNRLLSTYQIQAQLLVLLQSLVLQQRLSLSSPQHLLHAPHHQHLSLHSLPLQLTRVCSGNTQIGVAALVQSSRFQCHISAHVPEPAWLHWLQMLMHGGVPSSQPRPGGLPCSSFRQTPQLSSYEGQHSANHLHLSKHGPCELASFCFGTS